MGSQDPGGLALPQLMVFSHNSQFGKLMARETFDASILAELK